MSTHRDTTPDLGRLIRDTREKLETGVVPIGIFDDRMWEFERSRIFERQWIFLGHESEIPEPGDYVVRTILDASFIVTRAPDDRIHVLHNICAHQGMEVCRTDRGSSTHFRCPYHGWTYDTTGDLVGVPLKDQAYGGDLDPGEHRLARVQNADTYDGMIFANLDPAAEPLEDYLGDFTFYLDLIMGRSTSGMEVTGPQRRVVETNWKFGPINSSGDRYHGVMAHRGAIEVGVRGDPSDDSGEKRDAVPFIAGPGTGHLTPDSALDLYPEDVIESRRAALSEEQLELVETFGYPSNTTLFPNTTFNTGKGVSADGDYPFTYIRTLRPLGPNETEISIWHAIERDAPEEFKKRSRKAMQFVFGISGTFTQDDAEIWSGISRSGQTSRSRDIEYSYLMRPDPEPIDVDGVPGRIFAETLTENNARQFLRRYLDTLEEGGA